MVATTSVFFIINRLTNKKSVVAKSTASSKANSKKSENDADNDIDGGADSNFFTDLFALSASPRCLFAGAVGPILLGLGLGVATSAGFGSFGAALLLESLSSAFVVPFWLVLPVLTVSFSLVAWLWGRVPFGLGTLATVLLVVPAMSVGAGLKIEFGPGAKLHLRQEGRRASLYPLSTS